MYYLDSDSERSRSQRICERSNHCTRAPGKAHWHARLPKITSLRWVGKSAFLHVFFFSVTRREMGSSKYSSFWAMICLRTSRDGEELGSSGELRGLLHSDAVCMF